MIEIGSLYFFSILYQTALLKIKPFEKPSENYMEFFNEVCVSIVLLFYIMGTDIVENEDIRYYAGYGIVANLFANIGVNLIFFFYNAYFIVKPKFIRFWNKFSVCQKK